MPTVNSENVPACVARTRSTVAAIRFQLVFCGIRSFRRTAYIQWILSTVYRSLITAQSHLPESFIDEPSNFREASFRTGNSHRCHSIGADNEILFNVIWTVFICFLPSAGWKKNHLLIRRCEIKWKFHKHIMWFHNNGTSDKKHITDFGLPKWRCNWTHGTREKWRRWSQTSGGKVKQIYWLHFGLSINVSVHDTNIQSMNTVRARRMAHRFASRQTVW